MRTFPARDRNGKLMKGQMINIADGNRGICGMPRIVYGSYDYEDLK